MINLLKINPTGYFSYGYQDTVDIQALGTVLVDGLNHDKGGGANGSGKTSLFNSICHILFGKNPTGATADDITNARLGRRCGIVLFEDNTGSRWRIIEIRKWKKGDKYPDPCMDEPSTINRLIGRYTGSDVFLEKWNGIEWVDERGTNKIGKMKLTTDATRQKIASILNCTYEQFVDTCYLIQQEGLRLVSGGHKERYAIIARLTNIDKWEARKNTVAADRIRLEQELVKSEAMLAGMSMLDLGQIEVLRQEIAIKEADNKSLRDQIIVLEAEAATVQAAIDVAAAEVDASWLIRNKILSDIKDIDISIRNINEISKTNLIRYYDTISNIKNNTDIPLELSDLMSEEMTTSVKISTLNADLNNLISGATKCPKCKSYVTIEHIERHRELIKLEILELESKLKDIRSKIELISSQLEIAKEEKLIAVETAYNSDNAKLMKELQDFQSKQVKIASEAELILNKWQDNNKNINELKARLSVIPTSVSQLNLQIQHNIIDIANIMDRINKLEATIENAEALKIDINKKNTRIKALSMVERLFGDRGMQAFVLKNTIDQLNQIISNNLPIVSKSMKMWVSAFKEKSDGTLGVEIQVYVKDGSKDQIPFSLYSGGERQILNLVLLDAYSELAARMGTGFNILFLDEIFGPLDGTNAARVFEYIESMSSRNRSSIFLTAHDATIKDSVKFDTIITATKTKEQTVLTINKDIQ